MAKWRAQPIYIWFHDKYDTNEENCLPYNPNHFYVHIQGNNEEIDMLQGPITIQKTPKLVEYDPIECFFAHPDIYRVMRSKKGYDWTPSKWESFFRDAMMKKKVLELTVTGKNWVDEVTVEDFQYGPKAGVEKDSQYTIKIKQYRRPVIKKENIVIEKNYPQTGNINPQYNGDAIPAKTSIGANNLWLVGEAYKSNNGDMLANIMTLPNGKVAEFYYMPISVEQKGEIRNASIRLTALGEKLLKEIKEQRTYEVSGNGPQLVSLAHFKLALKNIKELNDDMPELLSIIDKFFIYKYGIYVKDVAIPTLYTFDYNLFLKMLLNREDRVNLTMWMKNNMVKNSQDRDAILLSNKTEILKSLNNLKNSYANADAPSETVLNVKFLEDVKFENIYNPSSNKYDEGTIFKKDDRFWVYEKQVTKENKPFKEFKLTWSK